jgi:hypothetical protein
MSTYNFFCLDCDTDYAKEINVEKMEETDTEYGRFKIDKCHFCKGRAKLIGMRTASTGPNGDFGSVNFRQPEIVK